MVNKIKLFENWAEEIEVPEYLDPKWNLIKDSYGGYSIFDNVIKIELAKSEEDSDEYSMELRLDESNSLFVNFQHFYELPSLAEYYELISIDQNNCKYRLQDFEGVPITNDLSLHNTKIKTLKMSVDLNLYALEVTHSFLENLKYFPDSYKAKFCYNPLLSYYGIGSSDINFFNLNLCGKYCYRNENSITKEDMKSIEFHAEQFCNFKNEFDSIIYSNRVSFNPWEQVYYDPNDVENFDFLFFPFYMNSEMFREKAKTMIADIDLGKLSKEELW
jgi:hypothetical protein